VNSQTFFPHPILNKISIQIKTDRGKIYLILPHNELFTFWQIIYPTPCIKAITSFFLKKLLFTISSHLRNLGMCVSKNQEERI
jgi:hypothetical protein